MAQIVHVPGAELACVTRGSGTPVLLVHGIAERAAGWEPVAGALGDGLGAIAYDRRGYGASTAPEPYERTTVAEQAEDAACLLEALADGPAVVCGRDLGALVALDLVRRHRGRVSGVVAIDPALYAFSARATEVLSAERVALEERLREAGAAAAVQTWLEDRGSDPRRLEWAASDHGAFFADFAGLATWPVLRRELRTFDVPLAVVVTAAAPPHVREVAEALAAAVPGATLSGEGDLVPAIRRLAGSP